MLGQLWGSREPGRGSWQGGGAVPAGLANGKPGIQARENSLGSFLKNKQTLMFNGYADQVAKMYEGMDLKKFY